MSKLLWPIGSPERIREFNECFKELWKLTQKLEGYQEEMRAFGAPSECWTDVWKGVELEVGDILSSWGFRSIDHFGEEASMRGYGKLFNQAGLAMFGPMV